MARTHGLAVAAASVLVSCAAAWGGDEPGVRGVKGAASAAAEAGKAGEEKAVDWGALSLDELIDRLPAAGSEWVWDRKKSDGVEAPASAEMEKRMNAGATLTDEQWRRVLIGTGAVRLRERWPKDVEYAASMTVPRWLGVTQIRLKPRAEGMEEISAGETYMGWSGTFPMIRARDARVGNSMGKVPEGTKEIVFDVEIERGSSMMDALDEVEEEKGKKKPARPKPGIIWKGTLTTPVQLVESWKEAVPAQSGAELDAAVRDAIGAGVRPWGDDPAMPFALIDPDCAKFPALATMGLAIKVELISREPAPKQERVIAEGWLLAGDADPLRTMSSIHSGPKRLYGSTSFKVEDKESDKSAWVLRLTDDADRIWPLWHAKTRWAGKMEIPWAEAVAHEQKRAGPEGRGGEASTPYMR